MAMNDTTMILRMARAIVDNHKAWNGDDFLPSEYCLFCDVSHHTRDGEFRHLESCPVPYAQKLIKEGI